MRQTDGILPIEIMLVDDDVQYWIRSSSEHAR